MQGTQPGSRTYNRPAGSKRPRCSDFERDPGSYLKRRSRKRQGILTGRCPTFLNNGRKLWSCQGCHCFGFSDTDSCSGESNPEWRCSIWSHRLGKGLDGQACHSKDSGAPVSAQACWPRLHVGLKLGQGGRRNYPRHLSFALGCGSRPSNTTRTSCQENQPTCQEKGQ